MKYLIFSAIAACVPPAAAGTTAQPHPADPQSAARAARHESAFAGYRAYRDVPLASWKTVNDEVARAGGHIGILKAGSGTQPASAGRENTR